MRQLLCIDHSGSRKQLCERRGKKHLSIPLLYKRTFGFSLGPSCNVQLPSQHTSLLLCPRVSGNPTETVWCLPQNDVSSLSMCITALVLWSTGEMPAHALLSVSGLWTQGISKRFEDFFLETILFQCSDLCPCPWPCWASRASATSVSSPLYVATHTHCACRAHKTGWEQQYWCVCCKMGHHHPGDGHGHLRGNRLQGTRRHKAVSWLSVWGWSSVSMCKIREKLQEEHAELHVLYM